MDSILFWNAVALEANRVSFSDPAKAEQQGPTLSSRALAIVHLAMYDAYAGIENNTANSGGFPRYLPAPPLPPPVAPNSSIANAVAGAAFRTLSGLYKTQRDYFESQLSCFDRNDPYFGFGMDVGSTLLKLRENDPSADAFGYMASMKRYRHRVDPDNPGQGFHAPYYGYYSKPFASKIRHKLDKPPVLPTGNVSAEYVAALRQVRSEGIKAELMATLPDTVGAGSAAKLFANRRIPEETLVGIYWAYDGSIRLGTPPRFYNQIIRDLAMNTVNPQFNPPRKNNEGDNARLFAFVNAAMGDAGIFAWEQKYCHDLWRPVVGIREHDESFGPQAPHNNSNADQRDGDAGWLPLGAPNTNNPMMKNFTPNFPAYPSGHATFGAAALHIARLFYKIPKGNRTGDNLFPRGLVSEEFNGMNRDNMGTVRPRHVRKFKGGLWDMIIENATSRVFLGVHWIFDAFDLKVTSGGEVQPDVNINNDKIGGVGLGLRIAEDIFDFGGKKAPKFSPSTADPSDEFPQLVQPATVNNCAEPKPVKKKKDEDKKGKGERTNADRESEMEEEMNELRVETPYLDGVSPR